MTIELDDEARAIARARIKAEEDRRAALTPEQREREREDTTLRLYLEWEDLKDLEKRQGMQKAPQALPEVSNVTSLAKHKPVRSETAPASGKSPELLAEMQRQTALLGEILTELRTLSGKLNTVTLLDLQDDALRRRLAAAVDATVTATER